MPFDRNSWAGARNCAVVDSSNVYCFDSNKEFGAFTDRSSVELARTTATTSPGVAVATGTCNCYAKIWDGANYTGRGPAFHNYGSDQDLADYAPVPFSLRSWFTNGQRSYAAMTNCYGWLLSSDRTAIYVTLHTNSQALSTAPTGVYWIRLNPGTG